ncbi:hypothetical protein XELAEV_18029047mg [Xenopus laevis]|uniref:Uncharacterized protein n=1 Tax=Xenopus laevis TaxID=8355 RepID=A0A974CQZ8_XENLA|nr:hypothetical protein XELAEV_18029047mg [Xenopus laevis]
MHTPTSLWACVQKPLLHMCAQTRIPNRHVLMPLPSMRAKAATCTTGMGAIWLAGLPRAASKPGPPLLVILSN